MDVAELGISFFSRGEAQVRREMESIKRAGAGVEAQYRAIEQAAGGLSSREAATVRSLQNKIVATQLSSRELAVNNALMRAGADANSVAGGAIAELARAHHDLTQKQKATNESSSNLANTLTRRFIMGFVISQLRQVTQAIVDLNSQLAKTGDIANRIGFSGSGLQGLQNAFAFKGGDANALPDAMIKFNAEVANARLGVGSLGVLLAQNGMAVKDTESAFFQVAELVKNAAKESDKFAILQQAGLPATREMVKLMEQGAFAIRNAAGESVKMTDQQFKDAQLLEERWNKMWNTFTQLGKAAVLAVGTAMSSNTLNKGLTGTRDPITGDNVFEGGRTGSPLKLTINKPSVNPEELKKINDLEMQRINLLGQTATVSQQVRLVELQIAQARLNSPGLKITKDELDNLKRLAEERALGIDQIKSQTDAYSVEAATIGMTTGEADAYRAVQTKINEQRRLGVPLSDEYIARLRSEADALRVASDNVAMLRFGNETFRGVFSDVVTGIRNGASAFDALEKAGMNALNKITDKLVQMAADQLWKSAFGGTGGGGGTGIFGSLFGGPSQGFATGADLNTYANAFPAPVAHSGWVVGAGAPPATRFVNPSVFAGARRMHKGGIAGDEVATILQRGETVIPKGGSVAPNVNVIIQNESGAKVERPQTQRNSNGGFDLKVMIRDVVRSEMGNGGMDDVMSRFGSAPGAVRR